MAISYVLYAFNNAIGIPLSTLLFEWLAGIQRELDAIGLINLTNKQLNKFEKPMLKTHCREIHCIGTFTTKGYFVDKQRNTGGNKIDSDYTTTFHNNLT